jgi:hypothetical protein
MNKFPELFKEVFSDMTRNGGLVALELLCYQLSYIRVSRYNKTAMSLCEACRL